MGKSRTTQTARGSSSAIRGAGGGGQDQVQSPTAIKRPPSTSSLTGSLTSRSPSPLLETSRHLDSTPASPTSDDEDNETFYDIMPFADWIVLQPPTFSVPKSQRAVGVQQAPAQATTDDDIFYDALDDEPTVPTPTIIRHQRAIGIQQAEGASKGRTSVGTNRARSQFRGPAPSSTTPYSTYSATRGPSQPTVSPTPTASLPSFPPLFAPSAPSGPVKKGLLIGVNYTNSKHSLQHATKDAVRFGQVLTEVLQFPEENLVFVTDMEHDAPACPTSTITPGSRRNQGVAGPISIFGSPNEPRWQGPVHTVGKKKFVEPTRTNMLEGFRWLVKGAKAGDDLMMLFSGHCVYVGAQGPFLVTTSAMGAKDMISKQDLRDELLLKVPKGCRINIVFDCCNSSALFDLQYCVGNMRPQDQEEPEQEPEQESEQEPEQEKEIATASLSHHVTSKLSQAQAPACLAPLALISAETKPALAPGHQQHDPLQGSLYGVQPLVQAVQNLGPVAQAQEPEPAVSAEDPKPTVQAQDPEPVAQVQAQDFALDVSAQESVPAVPTQDSVPIVRAQDPTPVVQPQDSLPAAESCTSPPTRSIKRPCGVVAAPAPLPTQTATSSSTSWIPGISGLSAWMKGGATSSPVPAVNEPVAATTAGVRQARNCVVEAIRPTDYFEERKGLFDQPEGDVTVWAAAGPRQSAYEASRSVTYGIVTNAICKALEGRKEATCRDLWANLRNDVESENKDRSRRDLRKKDRPDPRTRVQYASLWVSQLEPLYSAAPILNRRAFCPTMEVAAQTQVAATV